MTIELGNQDKLAMFRREMLEKGIPLLPPDVNASDAAFSVVVGPGGTGVRYALAGIKGVGLQAARALVAAREVSGPFRDLHDLCRRVGGKVLNKRLLESLIRAGALDGFDANRRRLSEEVDPALRAAAAAAEDADAGQVSLFEDAAIGRPGSPPAQSDLPDWPLMERLGMELDAVGFYMSAHPLDGYRGALRKLGVVDAAHARAELGGRESGRLRLAGVVVGKQERTTDRARFAFVQLSDPSGTFEVTVWSDLLGRVRDLLTAQTPLLVDAEARQEGDSLRLIAQRIEPLDGAVDASGLEVEIRVADAEAARRLEGLLRQAGPRAARVRLVLPTSRAGEEATIVLPPAFGLRHAGLLDVERAPGVVSLRELGRAH
jgi:DNA polymerase-3 subunit alpha